MKKLLLIDSDMILWKTCPNSTLSETEQMYGVNNTKTPQETLDLIDWYLEEKIFKPTKADCYIGFLGGERNYRYSIDSGYKAGRSTEKPPYFKEAKQYLVEKYKFVVVDGIEAEDAVGITLSANMLPTTSVELWGQSFNIIIVGQDHDLLQLPGIHYNPVKDEWKDVSKEQALYNYYHQILTGCTTDKVQGIPKVGEKTATKILAPYFAGMDLLNLTYDAYLKYYKTSELAGEKFNLTKDLITILREKEDFIIPEIQYINKQNVEQIIPEF